MVLTRAQAAAQAAAQAVEQAAAQTAAQVVDQAVGRSTAQDVYILDFQTEEETSLVEYSSVGQTSVAQNAPGTNDHIANLARHFIAQTQALAAEQAMLHSRQQGQCDAQNAALVAVQASAEANVQHLAEQQRIIVQQLGEALTATHTEVQEKFQRLEVLENEKKCEIEHFVNEKLDQALQEVQRTTHETQLVIASQSDVACAQFKEFEVKIASNLEAISARIHQVVVDKLAELRGEIHPGEDISHLVQQMVEVSSKRAAESIKNGLEAELRNARGEMQREIASGVEGPMREYVGQLVLEVMTQRESQLEARVQRALMSTQADVHFQPQRRADASSFEAKICSDLEAIPTRIHQVVEDKLAVLRGDMRPGENINHLVQRMVEAASKRAAEINRRALEAKLDNVQEKMQREIASGLEGPMRESVRQLVLEVTAQRESQLEARVQRALMSTQADVHLQSQRQADATSVLRENLERHILQTRSEAIPVVAASMNSATQDVNNTSQQVLGTPSSHSADRGEITAQSSDTIERSIQAAATTIANAIKVGIHGLNATADTSHAREQTYDDSEHEEDDEKMSTEELRLQQRIQDAWRRTYLDVSHDTTTLNAAGNVCSGEDTGLEETTRSCTGTCGRQVEAINCDQAQGPVERRSQTFDLAVDRITSPTNVVLVLQPLRHKLDRQPLVHQEQSWHSGRSVNVPPPPLPQIQAQEQSCLRHGPQTRSQDFRQLVASLQQQVAQRAEAAARRHLSNK